MGRRSVAEAIRPIRERAVASSSSAGRTITREMVAEACDTLVQERHPASPPVWPESDRSPTEDQPVEEKGEAGVLAEPPTPQRKLASTPAPQGDGSRNRPCSAPAPSSGRSRHHPCAAACPRPRHQRVMRTTSQAGRKIRRAVGRDLQGRWRTIRKRQGPIRRKRQGRSHRQHNWSWPSLMDWTFRPSRRSVICRRGPGPRFTSRGHRSGWSGPPRSGDEGRPRPWHSSWVDEGVNITRAGTAPCDNDQSAASMPLTSQRTEECGPPVCTIVRSVGC